MRIFSALGGIIRGLWRGLTFLRVAVLNLVFLAIIGVAYLAYLGSAPDSLPERYALLVNPAGQVVDQKSFVEPLGVLLSEPTPAEREVLLRDLVDAIELAAEDASVSALVLELDYLVAVGISKSQEIGEAIKIFRASGKPVIANGDYYTQQQYLIASEADTVILHPMGAVGLEGFASYRNYFRAALDKAYVTMHVFKAGEHKSMAEPFLRDDMSEAEREITQRWLDGLWSTFTGSVENQRGLEAGAVDGYVERYAEALTNAGGDGAALAFQAGLVDHLMTRGEANEYLVEQVGARDDEGLYEAVMFDEYLQFKRPFEIPSREPVVAVVTAKGNILPGDQPPGDIGGDSLSALIYETAQQPGVQAIVLRIDSGGGSVFASEVIRQSVLDAKSQGLPVVVSMGSVAASGGYYIAADADQIWATPTTVTGSIGVFAAFPTFERLLDKAGIGTDGVGTTSLAGTLRVDRALDPELAISFSAAVDHTYRSFVDIVANGRNMTFEQVDAIAQGRVWGAEDALENGLVDALGGLDDAVEAAAQLAGLSAYSVDFKQQSLSPRDMLLQQLNDSFGSLGLVGQSAPLKMVSRMLEPLSHAAIFVDSLQDPRNLYVRCISCEVVR
ncbi:MAG: signal peptide peptidase SppA [Halioglobus sp.]